MEIKKTNEETNLQKLFGFFKLSKSKKEFAQEPKDSKTWLIHAISELIGTIFISMGLAGLSIKVKDTPVEHLFLLHNIIVGFFAGFIVVGLCLVIFLRWSCDLNPAVTLTRYLNGTNTGRYALMKIGMQIIGSVIAGLLIYGIGTLTNKGGLPNAPIDAVASAYKSFDNVKPNIGNTNNILAVGGTWIFFVEMVMTAVLLFPIFSPNIRDKYRDVMIMFIISLSVWMGILGGSAAINPARGFAQQLPYLIFVPIKSPGLDLSSVTVATVTMILGGLAAPVFFLFCQGFTRAYFNPWFTKLVKFKNFKSDNMHTPNKK
ncbi:aquaporin [Mycoplasma crocodyli]|uniref:Putative membrane protein n=1 Tax=Mycoplasma crocodyli (strain ATCC 51981 / MP145) TaxID=512564 RepID=D5E609_MYCCM|nr:aquaporin [Mycoplasma crocodyli]ADE19851.1 putative membrane protein [Mycoplasma crocodyli MP145]